MSNRKWIEKWFEECTDLDIKPWNWDFKQCYVEEFLQTKKISNISLMLEYKSGHLNKIGPFNSTGKTGIEADCDKEPTAIYCFLWDLDRHNVIRGETMNSFITTFSSCIMQSQNKKSTYEEIDIDINQYLTCQYDRLVLEERFQNFELVRNNKKELEKFACNTHCIGSFIVLPHWMNTGRYNFSQDYWDITLQSFYDFLNPIGAWKKFVETYYLYPYVNNDSNWSVVEFWHGHFSKIGSYYKNLRPQNNDELRAFLVNVNVKIEERGKWIVKRLCEKLELTDYDFYREIKEMKLPFCDSIKLK
ncbi:TPA: hypothetical protein IU004_001410 [Enterococcus faecalis]|uniref:hypothetical protein n=1 Tax=Enterococcus faecalis TaxID=1351 RepID=UPI0029735C63|nr:hypothetical protein [Enterococcus faecalis]HAP5178403.1 hypothetical protein [Enterococcus faecalis]HAP5432308.1 hypothetical protein [Enterococcus faecalis]